MIQALHRLTIGAHGLSSPQPDPARPQPVVTDEVTLVEEQQPRIDRLIAANRRRVTFDEVVAADEPAADDRVDGT